MILARRKNTAVGSGFRLRDCSRSAHKLCGLGCCVLVGVLLNVAERRRDLLVHASSWSVPLFRCGRTGFDLAGNLFEVLRVQHDFNSTVG